MTYRDLHRVLIWLQGTQLLLIWLQGHTVQRLLIWLQGTTDFIHLYIGEVKLLYLTTRHSPHISLKPCHPKNFKRVNANFVNHAV